MQRQIFQVIHPLLKDEITDVWVIEIPADLTNLPPMKVPPMGFPVLQYHFGLPGNYYQHKHLTNQSVFVGQLTRHVILHPYAGMKLIGINFKPYGLYNLFGISPLSFQNSGFESRLFFGNEMDARINSLLVNASSIETVLSQLFDMLASVVNPAIQKNHYFDSIIDTLVAENGLVNPVDLIDKHASVRTFQRYFNKTIGLTPKLFAQVLRHKYICSLIYENPELKWNDLAIKGFYYDASHFHKDFVLFTDTKPMHHLTLRSKLAEILVDSEQ
jgi:hypothetical protein